MHVRHPFGDTSAIPCDAHIGRAPAQAPFVPRRTRASSRLRAFVEPFALSACRGVKRENCAATLGSAAPLRSYSVGLPCATHASTFDMPRQHFVDSPTNQSVCSRRRRLSSSKRSGEIDAAKCLRSPSLKIGPCSTPTQACIAPDHTSTACGLPRRSAEPCRRVLSKRSATTTVRRGLPRTSNHKGRQSAAVPRSRAARSGSRSWLARCRRSQWQHRRTACFPWRAVGSRPATGQAV